MELRGDSKNAGRASQPKKQPARQMFTVASTRTGQDDSLWGLHRVAQSRPPTHCARSGCGVSRTRAKSSPMPSPNRLRAVSSRQFERARSVSLKTVESKATGSRAATRSSATAPTVQLFTVLAATDRSACLRDGARCNRSFAQLARQQARNRLFAHGPRTLGPGGVERERRDRIAKRTQPQSFEGSGHTRQHSDERPMQDVSLLQICEYTPIARMVLALDLLSNDCD